MRPELFGPTQLVFRTRFDLTDALARQVETIADLLQRVRLVVFEAEAEAHHLALLAVEVEERRGELVEGALATAGPAAVISWSIGG